MSVRYQFLTKPSPALTPVAPVGTPNNSWWPDYWFPDQIWPTAAPLPPPPTTHYPGSVMDLFPSLSGAIAELNSILLEAQQNVLENHNAIVSAQYEIDTAVAQLASAQSMIAQHGISIGSMQTQLSSANIQILALQNGQESMAGTLTTLNARMGNAEGNITSLSTVVTNNYESLLGITNDLQSRFDQTTARLTADELTQATQFESLTASLLTQSSRIDNSLAILTIESFTRSTQTTSLASTLATLTVNMNGLTGQVSSEQAARIDGDTVNVTAITRMMAVATQQNVYVQTTQPTPPSGGFRTGDQWYNTSAGAFPYAWNGAAWVDNSNGQYSSLSASITAESSARVNDRNAMTALINTQISAVNGNIAVVSQQAATLSDQYHSLSGTVTGISAQTGQNTADIHTVQVAQANQYSDVVGRIDQVWTSLNGNTAGITQLTQAYNGIAAQWSLQATLNTATGGLTLTGIQRADGTGAVFTLDISANVRIHGSVMISGSLTTDKAANESWTVIRGAQINSASIPLGGPSAVYSWTFNSPLGGGTIVNFTTTVNGGASGIFLIWYLVLDGVTIATDGLLTSEAAKVFLSPQVDTTTGPGQHTLQFQTFSYYGDCSVGQSTSTLFIGAK